MIILYKKIELVFLKKITKIIYKFKNNVISLPELYKHNSELWSWIAENIVESDSDAHNKELIEEELPSENLLQVDSKPQVLSLNSHDLDLIVKSLEFCSLHKVILIDKLNIQSLKNRESISSIVKNNLDNIIKSVTIINNDPNYREMAGIDNDVDSIIILLDKLLECRESNLLIEYVN